MKTNIILNGDSLSQLKTLPNESIDCVMTSPPYWALRDYGVEGQLGLKPNFEEYINKLCNIFNEVKRVLKKSGTCWVNLGDSYSNSNWLGDKPNKWNKDEIAPAIKGRGAQPNYPDKSLCMIPFRFSIEMVNRGWILRNTIIWHKPNCMPMSVKDRFTVDFEYLFFFVKSKKYFFESQYEAIAESTKNDSRFNNPNYNPKDTKDYDTNFQQSPASIRKNVFNNKELLNGRNKRTVWKITTKPFKEAHFAVYPEELCYTPIKAGCPIGGICLDPFFGSGTTGLVALKQNKQFIGIELNKEYIKIAEARLKPYLEQEKLQ